MARSSKNTDLVPKKVIDELVDLNKQLQETKDNLIEVLDPVVELSNTFQSTAIGTAALSKAIKELSEVEGRSTDTQKKAVNILREIDRARQRLKALQSEEGKMLAKAKEELRTYNTELKRQAKESFAASNSIESMRQNVSRLKQAWAKADLGSQTFEKLSKDLAEANAKLTEAESKVGIFGRNVGNYQSAFNGLNYSVQQIARELPSMSIGLSQFFLAISNNIPILVDDINKVREANAQLAAEGKKGVPIFKQLAKSIFSWQTLLVVGVTLLTVYGKEIQGFIKDLFGVKESLGGVSGAIDKINESLKDGGLGIGDEITKLKHLQTQWNALGSDLEAKKKFIEDNKVVFDELGVSIENVSDAENLLVTNTDKFIKSLQLRAQSSAALKLASKAYEDAMLAEQKRMRILTGDGTGWENFRYSITGYSSLKEDVTEAKKNAETYTKVYENLLKEINKINEETGIKSNKKGGVSNTGVDKIAEFRKQLAEAEARAVIDGKQYQLKEGAELNKEIYRNELNSYEARMKAAEEYTQAMKDSIEARAEAQKNDLIRDAAIGLGLDPDKDRIKAEKHVAQQIEVINMKKNIEIEKMDRQHSEIVKDIWEDSVKQAVQSTIDSLNSALAESTNRENEAIQALNEKFLSGGMSNESYEIEKTKITEKYAEERIRIQINELEKRLELEGISEADRLALIKKISDLELKEKEIQSDKEIELVKKKNDMQKQLAKELYDFINQLVSQSYDHKLNKLEKEAESNEEWRDEELERIEKMEDAGAISKEQADARKAFVDEKAKMREKELEEQKKEILRKQAIYEKAQALAGIAINTGMAIMKTSAQWGYPAALPFIAAISALSAVQTASVLATPIPEYAEGTQDHPGGLAIVGDGGKSEMVIANGRIFKTPSTDTLVELPKHAMVIPDFAAGLEQAKISMNKTDRVISFEELSGLVREGNSKTDKLIQIIMRHNKNEVYARELSNIRRIKR